MNDLRQNYAHWRKIFIRINLSVAIIITIVEIVMSITMHFQNLIFSETLFEYVFEYLFQPNLVIWSGMLFMGLVFLVCERNKEYLQSRSGSRYVCGSLYDSVLNQTLIYVLTLSCGTAAYVHYIFRVTVVGFCIPIFLSIVFYSRRICIRTVFLSEMMLLAIAAHRFDRNPGNDLYIWEDVIIIMLFILVIGVIAVNVIVHMRKQHESMVEAREAAVIANQAKSSFLANMSHEIRTPINAVMGMDEMILRKSQDEEVLSYALDIKKASNALLSIINDILDVSKIESGKMEILPVEYDLAGLIHDVYNNLLVRARDKGLELKLDIDESLPKVLIGDDIRIRQIISNLLTNGVKYTMKGYVKLEMKGEPCDNGILLKVKVTDTGIGIKEEDMPLLMEKFQRLEERRNRNVEGTGLGMNISVSLLEMMGGSLHIESTYGSGSSFSFAIRQGIGDQEAIGDIGRRFSEVAHVSARLKEKEWIAPKAKILVVDDNAMNLKVFNQLLKPFMMRIDQAESGAQCLEKVEQIRYDIIFLDDMMPGLDGMRTLKLMKEMPENLCVDTPVICFTANAIKGAMENYIRAGFDGYLAKPIVPDKLETLIEELLGPELVEYSVRDASTSESELAEYSEHFDELCEVFEEAKDIEDRDSDLQPVQEAMEEEVSKPVFPEIFGINWNYGMTVWNNEALLLELAHDFYEDLPDVLEKLSAWEAEIEQEEAMKNFCIRVHALKGGAATIGAMNLSSMALILELASKEKNPEKVHQLWPYLKQMMEDYQENMKVLAGSDLF